jgi:hypothetical protein
MPLTHLRRLRLILLSAPVLAAACVSGDALELEPRPMAEVHAALSELKAGGRSYHDLGDAERAHFDALAGEEQAGHGVATPTGPIDLDALIASGASFGDAAVPSKVPPLPPLLRARLVGASPRGDR